MKNTITPSAGPYWPSGTAGVFPCWPVDPVDQQLVKQHGYDEIMNKSQLFDLD